MYRAVVLHRWPWQEHGLLLDVFSEQHGRFRAISKYARSRRSNLRAALEPFTVIDIEVNGRGEVKTLKRADVQATYSFQRIRLYSALYINELLQRLLPEHTEMPGLFADYLASLELLASDTLLEPILRQFEYRLLCHLDLGFSFTHDAEQGNAILAEYAYRFQAGSHEQNGGFIPCNSATSRAPGAFIIEGAEIARLAAFDLENPQVLKQFKRLMRIAYAPLLGSKPLRSRELLLASLGAPQGAE